jgi:hydrogenase expression/formation protein HypE
VQFVTGDTKVVDRGKGDGIFINTAGIGLVRPGLQVAPARVRSGDMVLLNGDVGRHGIAIMAVREGLAFDSVIESDSAPVVDLVMQLLDEGVEIHCMRDLTRGGLASAAVEIAEASGLEIRLDEKTIPVREDVRGACELLGFDPLYVANEGRFIAFVPPASAEKALQILRSHALGQGAAVIGQANSGHAGMVAMTNAIGTTRMIDMLSGEQLPRIC